MASGNGPEQQPVKNLHVEVPAAFHTRLKVLCAIKDVSLKAYALAALEEKVARDDALLAAGAGASRSAE